MASPLSQSVVRCARYGAMAGLLSLVIASLPGCSHTASLQERDVQLHVAAAPDSNPDDKRRPSPVVLHVFMLRNASRFSRADYFSLAHDATGALGNDLLGQQEIILRPGEQQLLLQRMPKEATAVGFVAAFRDLPRATWRVTCQTGPARVRGWFGQWLPDPVIHMDAQLAGIRLDVRNEDTP